MKAIKDSLMRKKGSSSSPSLSPSSSSPTSPTHSPMFSSLPSPSSALSSSSPSSPKSIKGNNLESVSVVPKLSTSPVSTSPTPAANSKDNWNNKNLTPAELKMLEHLNLSGDITSGSIRSTTTTKTNTTINSVKTASTFRSNRAGETDRRASSNPRMVNVEGWLELRYGERTTRVHSPAQGVAGKRYWFVLVGGFLSCYVQEDHHINAHTRTYVEKLDLKNDVTEVSEVHFDANSNVHMVSIVVETAVNKKEKIIETDGNTNFVKTSVKSVKEVVEYQFCSEDEALMRKLKDAISKSLSKKGIHGQITEETDPKATNPKRVSEGNSIPNHSNPTRHLKTRSLGVTEEPQDVPTSLPPKRPVSGNPSNDSMLRPTSPPPSFHSYNSSSSSSSSASSTSSNLTPSRGYQISGGLSRPDTKGRMVKQQGYLFFETVIEESGKVVSSKRQRYYFELMGGYLNWYQNEVSAQQSLKPIGRFQIKAGESEVGEVEQEYISLEELKNDFSNIPWVEEEEGEGVRFFHFTIDSNEAFHRKEEHFGTDASGITKTTIKKERSTYMLSSDNEIVIREWRTQVAAMSRRKVLSQK